MSCLRTSSDPFSSVVISMRQRFLQLTQMVIDLQAITWAWLVVAAVVIASEPAPIIPPDASPKLKGLMEKMLSKDTRQRELAVIEFERETKNERDITQVIPFLIYLLDDNGSQAESRACVALTKIGEPAVVPLL